jgi:hypothetical protein
VGFKKVRRHSRIEKELPPEIREQVDALLIQGETYETISDFLKAKGYDISRSSIGRYGKEFLQLVREIKILEDQAKAIVSDTGEGLLLEEAASKLFSKNILKMLLEGNTDIKEIPKIISGFARLQASSISREKFKAEISDKVKKAAKDVSKVAKKRGLSPEAVKEIEEKILGIVD